jgi:integrase/recombinase XerD
MKEINFDYEKLADVFLEKIGRKNISITLEKFFEEVLGYVKRNRSNKTYEGAKLVCDKLLKFFSPLKTIDTLTQKDAEDWLDFEKRTAKKAFRNYYRVARALFNKAQSWNYISENPFNKIKLEKVQKEKPAYVTEDILWSVTLHIKNEIVRDGVILAFFSGVRLGEVVSLTWDAVNLKEEVLIIGKDFDTKSRKQRYVPMHTKVKEILIKRLEGQGEPSPKSSPFSKGRGLSRGYVFCKSTGYPFTTDYFSRSFKRACRDAGVDEEIHFHSIRHGAITRMITKGANLPAVQRIAGHSSIQTTMIYTHPDLHDLRSAIAKL